MPITIETTVQIEADRKVTVQLPPSVPLGRHRVVTVVTEAPDETAIKPAESTSLEFPVIANAQWPADMPMNREELYNDDGR
jgi:hypothetical protein